MTFHEATSVGVDSQDRVYVFNRGDWPMMVFDRDGNFVETWGAGEFDHPHGIAIDDEDRLYLTDQHGHFIQKRTSAGEVLFTIGERGVPCPAQSGSMFNQPTQVAVQPGTGHLFATDGYRNSRVHKFDADGAHITSWGRSGTGPGEFSLPHSICMLGDDRVVVCDRENFRIQVFTPDGEYVTEHHFHKAQAVFAGRGEDTSIYLLEGRPPPLQDSVARLGRRVVILDRDLNVITSFGAEEGGEGADQFISPHGVAVDSEGSVYIAEVSFTARGSRLDPPREVISMRKWRRVSG